MLHFGADLALSKIIPGKVDIWNIAVEVFLGQLNIFNSPALLKIPSAPS